MKKLLLFLIGFPFLIFAQTPDSTLVSSIDSLLKIAEDYEVKGQYQNMQDHTIQALALIGQNIGKKSEKYADGLLMLGTSYMELGKLPIADSLFLEAKEIFIATSGEGSQKHASSLYSISTLKTHLGKFGEAANTCLRAIGIYEKCYGKMHLKYSESVELLGIIYLFSGQHEKAEPLLLESQQIGGKLLGKEHSDYATTLSFIAMLYMNMGRYEEAEPLLLEMRSIYEKTLGPQHIDYAISSDNLAQLYMHTGRYDKAEPLFIENLSIAENVLGKTHPVYGQIANNLAVLYWELGRLEAAEKLNSEALKIIAATKGKESLDYATILQNLASIYQKMGRYKDGEALTLENLEILEKVVGKEHWKYPQLLGNLAIFYQNRERYADAENAYLQAKAIQEKILEEDHQIYGLTLYNLGNLYYAMKKYEAAGRLFEKAKAIYKKSAGIKNNKYAAALRSLAVIRRIDGDFEEAQSMLLEAQNILENLLGSQNLPLSETLKELAKLHLLNNQNELASAYFVQYNQVNQLLQLQRASHFSDMELQAYQTLFESANYSLLSFAQENPSPSILQSTYNHTLFQKGFLLDNAIKREQLVANAPQEIQEIHIQWKGYLRRLAKEYSKPIKERASITPLLEKKAIVLEKELQQSIAEFDNTRQSVTWQQIQAQLPPNSVAIEFIHYQYHNPEPTDSIFYSALLLRPGDEAPTFIPLFEEGQLQELLQSKDISRPDFLNQLYAFSKEKTESLQSLIWQPLEKELAGVNSIYFSPSGLLHRLHLGAISINDKEKLADRFHLAQLGSTRQLLSRTLMEKRQNEAILFGGINYELDTTTQISSLMEAISEETFDTRGNTTPLEYGESLLRGDDWKTLTWTLVEVEGIEGILQDHHISTSTQTGQMASEENFQKMGQGQASPRILHLATHGYFFPDPKEDRNSPSAFKSSSHPMIRSGLILAGANHVWKGQKAIPGKEDGILTAYEISQMNLSNTELVVLSACETGLGDIEGNEGVYGLQRAFKIAGAKYLIMSLWQVPDFQTQELMTNFYIEWLEEKKPIPEAFRAAQTQMRERYPDPFNWAGFVLVE